MIRRGSTGGAWGALEMEVVGGSVKDTVRITRYRKHPQFGNKVVLRVRGKDVTCGTDTETNAAIVRLLGMDFTAYCNAVAFSAREDVAGFFSATDTERKAVLERILGLGVYAEAAVAAKVERVALGTALAQAREREQRCVQAVAGKQSYLDGIASQFDAVAQRKAVQAAEAAVQAAQAAHKRAAHKVAALKQNVTLAEEADKAESARYAAESEAYAVWSEVLEGKLRSARSAVSKAQAICGELSQQERKVRGLGGECPTCMQKVSVKMRDSVATGVHKALVLQQQRVTAAEMEVDLLAKEEQARVIPQAPETGLAVSKAKSIWQLAERDTAEAKRTLEQRTQACEELAERTKSGEEELAQARAALVQAERALAEAQATIPGLETKAAEAAFWEEGFGNRGLKAFLIEAKLPFINARATLYAKRLCGEGAYVKLRATTALSSRAGSAEKISIEGNIPGRTKTYAGASRGEKNRLNLCLLLTLRDIAAGGAAGLEQSFVDELFDGLDDAGTDRAIELLRETAEKRPVFMATHNPRLLSAGDREWQVKHNGKEDKPMATVQGEGVTCG